MSTATVELGLRAGADSWAALRKIAEEWPNGSRLGVYHGKPQEATRRLQEEQRYLMGALRLLKGRTETPASWDKDRPARFLRPLVRWSPVNLLGSEDAPSAHERIDAALRQAIRLGVLPSEDGDLIAAATFELERGIRATIADMDHDLPANGRKTPDQIEHTVGVFEDYLLLLERAAEQGDGPSSPEGSEGVGQTLTAKIRDVLTENPEATAAGIVDRLGLTKTDENTGKVRSILSRLRRQQAS